MRLILNDVATFSICLSHYYRYMHPSGPHKLGLHVKNMQSLGWRTLSMNDMR